MMTPQELAAHEFAMFIEGQSRVEALRREMNLPRVRLVHALAYFGCPLVEGGDANRPLVYLTARRVLAAWDLFQPMTEVRRVDAVNTIAGVVEPARSHRLVEDLSLPRMSDPARVERLRLQVKPLAWFVSHCDRVEPFRVTRHLNLISDSLEIGDPEENKERLIALLDAFRCDAGGKKIF